MNFRELVLNLIHKLNPVIIALLKSPFHALISGNIMSLSFTGRKSGKRYTTPVSYVRADGMVYAFTHATWWKNLQGGAPVTLRLRERDHVGVAEAVSADKPRIAQGLGKYLAHRSGRARFYQVALDENQEPNAQDLCAPHRPRR